MISTDQEKKINLDSGISAWVDSETSLMWEVKNNDNFKFMYVWSKSRVSKVAESSKSSMEEEVKDCESYIERMNATSYSGFNDWRLPTIEELKSILSRSENGHVNVKPPLSGNCMRGTWSDTPAMAVHVIKVTGDWRNEAYIPTIFVLDLSKMAAVPYDQGYTLWIRAVRNQ